MFDEATRLLLEKAPKRVAQKIDESPKPFSVSYSAYLMMAALTAQLKLEDEVNQSIIREMTKDINKLKRFIIQNNLQNEFRHFLQNEEVQNNMLRP